MASTPFYLQSLFLLLFAFRVTDSLVSHSGPQIADLNVLLPPRMTNPVHYRLRGTGGCFSWTWDHHDILRVEPEYNGTSRCSVSARLVSTAPYSGRKETAVYATDVNSGTVIRCEVFVDKISRIQIFHHSLKLDLDGFATLQIRAFDREDNVFSSLVGLRFAWQLTPKTVEMSHDIHHIVHVPLKETPLTDCGGFCGDLDTQIRVEESGMGSDLYVVKGIEIGLETITARLCEIQYENVTDEIVLTVAEAMSLHPPSPVFLLVGSLIQYKLRIVHQNVPQVVDLPSPVHRWASSNSTVAQIDFAMGYARSLKLGTTNVIVEDTRVSGHVQISSMHVVIPDKLCLYLMPTGGHISNLETSKCSPSVPWFVVIAREYIINAKAFTHEPDVNEIYITESNRLALGGDSLELWEVFPTSHDVVAGYGRHSFRILKPRSSGQGYLSGSLSYYFEDSETAEVLNVDQRVIVCSEVKIKIGDRISQPKIIKLPWAPGVYQELELNGFGGCGLSSRDYIWSSSNLACVSVSPSGNIQAKYPGRSTIRVTSFFDPLNFDEITVEVSTPASMALSHKFPVEAAVGTHLFAGVLLKSSDGSYYDQCDAFNFVVKWRVVSEIKAFLVTNKTEDDSDGRSGSHCSWRFFYASNPGQAVLHASFLINTQSGYHLPNGDIALETSVQIAAYPDLSATQAGNGDQYGGYHWEFPRQGVDKNYFSGNFNELFLAPGSSMDVLILGGPVQWGYGVEYIDAAEVKSVPSLHSERVVSKMAVIDHGTLYRILCQEVGNFNVIFYRGNLAGDNHPIAVISLVEMTLVCSLPFSIVLIANEESNTLDAISSSMQAERGSGNVHLSPNIVENGQTIRLAAVGTHVSGKPFANSSSLALKWELTGCGGLGKWAGIDSSPNMGMNWERFLVLENSSGLCTVRATVTGISERIFRNPEDAYPLPEISLDSLTDAVYLQLVSSLRIIPESVLLYFHPHAKVNLSVCGGTGFIDAVVNDTKVAELVQLPKNEHYPLLILASRGLGVALLTIYDSGLSPTVHSSALVTVADISWIKIIGPDEISIMEGTRCPLEIVVGTTDGSIFDSSMYSFMDIYVHFEDGVVDLENEDGSPAASNGKLKFSKFFLKARNLGLTSLSFSARLRSGHDIFSQILKVEVYQQLRISPSTIFLVPGASYMFSVEGGPTLGSGMDYESLDENIAFINDKGRVTAISMGNTSVRVSMFKHGGSLFCEASAKVEVGVPSVWSLNIQSEHLCVGCQMPVFPSFPKGDLFSFYEVCKDYKWSVEDEKVLSLRLAQHLRLDSHLKKDDSDSLHDKEYGFINFLHGRSEGVGKFSVSFSCYFDISGGSKATRFNASGSVMVVPELPLALGLPITWVLPPYYTTSNILPGTSEVHKPSDLHRRRTSITYSVLSSCGRDDIIQQEEIVVSGTKIKTQGVDVLGCIQAKDQSGRLQIAACVRVAEVTQIRADTGSSPSHVSYLSLDGVLDVSIGYCDKLGYPFREAFDVIGLEVQTNYPDVVSILGSSENDKTPGRDIVHIKAKSHGGALVKISFKQDPLKAAYILVFAGPRLYPENPLIYTGCVARFNVTGFDAPPQVGEWILCISSSSHYSWNQGADNSLVEIFVCC
ncbi:embryo defective 3012 isoform X2 [Wolffia australiana]